jgi:microcystin-dependent protein
MAQPYVGEIRMFAGNFAPAGWMFCNGNELPISENETLFILIGTTYGGDGQSTFALPNLQSRIPIHQGQGPGTSNHILGEPGGVEEVTLSVQQIPTHSHPLLGSTALGTQEAPGGNLTGQGETVLYGELPPTPPMDAGIITPVGGSQPHDNMQPYLVINYIISLFGIFPSQA